MHTFRWEFALPESDELSREVERFFEYFAHAGILDGAGSEPARWLLLLGPGILQNFREAYWVAARTLLDLPPEGMGKKALLAKMRKTYTMYLLLERLAKPEGNSTITFSNAINRYAELGFARLEKTGRELWIHPGEKREELMKMEEKLADSLGPWPKPLGEQAPSQQCNP